MSVHDIARVNMIESQLRPNKVTDERIIEAFSRLRRELFVPAHLRGVAYVDEDLPLGRGRYLMEPMVAARLLQALMPNRKETALVVGAGVGYEAALLGSLTRSVIALEEDEELARLGRAALVDHRIAPIIYVSSRTASAPTLTEASAYSYISNPQVVAQRAVLRATDEQVPQALSNWRPTVSLTGQAGFERAGTAGRGTSTAFSAFEPRSLDLRVTQ